MILWPTCADGLWMFMLVSVFIIKKNDSLIKHRLFLLASQSDKDTFDGAQEEIEKEYHV